MKRILAALALSCAAALPAGCGDNDRSANVMNQGEARAYGATSGDGQKNLQVVASAIQDGSTSVQISWSAGR